MEAGEIERTSNPERTELLKRLPCPSSPSCCIFILLFIRIPSTSMAVPNAFVVFSYVALRIVKTAGEFKSGLRVSTPGNNWDRSDRLVACIWRIASWPINELVPGASGWVAVTTTSRSRTLRRVSDGANCSCPLIINEQKMKNSTPKAFVQQILLIFSPYR